MILFGVNAEASTLITYLLILGFLLFCFMLFVVAVCRGTVGDPHDLPLDDKCEQLARLVEERNRLLARLEVVTSEIDRIDGHNHPRNRESYE